MGVTEGVQWRVAAEARQKWSAGCWLQGVGRGRWEGKGVHTRPAVVWDRRAGEGAKACPPGRVDQAGLHLTPPPRSNCQAGRLGQQGLGWGQGALSAQGGATATAAAASAGGADS